MVNFPSRLVVVNQARHDHAGRAESADEGVSELGGLFGLEVEDVESLGPWPAVVVEQALSVAASRVRLLGEGIDSFGEFER